jgi:hypothetical protein
MSYQRIAGDFHQRIDLIAAAVDAQAPGLEQAAGLIVEAALSDRRVFLVCGDRDSGIADYLSRLLRQGEGSLPSLPVLALQQGQRGEESAPLWRDLRALARDGDLLLCIDSLEGAPVARRAALLAGERNLSAVLLSDAAQITGSALLIPLQAPSSELRRELALMAMHSLHRLILELLMGET